MTTNQVLVHRVMLHKEHDATQTAVFLVCVDHYLTAEACDMITEDYGLEYTTKGCHFCR